MTSAGDHPSHDIRFTDAVSRVYERYLVPLIFEPYATVLATRLVGMRLARVLEVAAGTGVVTRALASLLPEDTAIVATDLNQAMIDQARLSGTSRPVEWRQADALRLPFPDGSFDAVVCQFGAMFFPDKAHAFRETRRVLAPGGLFLFAVWDRIEDNEFADVVTSSLVPLFPEDPPRFLARTPHGYIDTDMIRRDLAAGGFETAPDVTTRSARSRAASPEIPAIAYVQGTPLRNEVEARAPGQLEYATHTATTALAGRFGRGEIEGKIQAHIISVER